MNNYNKHNITSIDRNKKRLKITLFLNIQNSIQKILSSTLCLSFI